MLYVIMIVGVALIMIVWVWLCDQDSGCGFVIMIVGVAVVSVVLCNK